MTTVTLELSSELAGSLTRQAEEHGMTLDEFLMVMARQAGDAPVARPLHLPRFDPYLAAAGRNNQAAAAEAERLGITDGEGNLCRSELPDDMREGAERDFGG